MEVKKMVKRILAVGAGATMLGATVMGAMAADLSSYPGMFVSDGVFNGLLVVGENAAAVDNLAMTDIAASMKYKSADAGATVKVEGDAWLVKSGTDELEFGEAIGPAGTNAATQAQGVVDFLDSDDLAALADGQLSSSKGTFDYEQFLFFDDVAINTTYAEDDDDVTALFLKVGDNRPFARYQLNFLDAAKSDIDSSESFKLDDFEDKTLTMMGRTYDIVKAVTGGANSNKVTLTLMAGAVKDAVLEGESKTYTLGGEEYELSLVYTSTSDRAKFTVNGESTPVMDEGDTETLADGTVLGLSEVLYQDYAGGVHQAEFFLGASKLELEDDSIITAGSTDSLKVNDEIIDGTKVEFQGSYTDNATSTSEDGEMELDIIEVNMTAEEDYFIAAGETLLGQPELTEKDLVFTNWDIRFEGMDTKVKTDMIQLSDAGGEAEYELAFTNLNGDVIKVPLAFASGATLRLGDSDDNLTLSPRVVRDDQFFILNDDTDEDSVTHVLQYKGVDDNAQSDPKAKFKVLATGETIERPVTFGTTATFNIKLSGTTYNFENVTAAATNSSGALGSTNSDDWAISLVSGGAVTWVGGISNNASGGDAINETSNYLITRGGGRIGLLDRDGNRESGSGSINVNVTLIDADRVDDRATVPYLVWGNNITAAASEVDLTNRIGIALVSPDDDDDNSYGYSSNGAWVKYTSPTGGGSSADNVQITWPQDELLPLVYVTSGAVASSKTAAGDLKAVTFVDATKLDSEVADAKAQNLVVIGGPCVNTVAAELLGSPADCTEGFTPGKSRVKLFEHANGNVAMLVAGYSGADTRLAGKVVANRASELSGKEMVVEGTTYADAKLSKPSAAAPAAKE